MRALQLLLLLCIARLWLMPLPSSFWLDEMATVFVAHHGSQDPSLATVAPQAWRSIYYALPRASEKLLGFSEAAYRLPSILAMALALFFVARLAIRLIHPEAGWFAVFACLALGGVNYHAADARPYALGFCLAAGSLLWLVRWLDRGRLVDGLMFVVFASLLWRVHLLFWPMYIVFALYAMLRRGTRIRTAILFVVLAVTLLPVLAEALALYREAGAHVFAPSPSLRDLASALKWPLPVFCGIAAWLALRGFHWHPPSKTIPAASLALILGYWLCQSLCLFALSRLTGHSVFVPRYLSIALPGAALAATLAASYFVPAARWRQLSLVLGAAAVLWLGQWRTLWPLHHNSDWRAAAQAINRLPISGDTPVLCPSPFLEAIPPAWSPGYPLSGFFYSHLAVYPVRGRIYTLPFTTSPEAERLARTVSRDFVLYGWEPQVHFWRDWLAAQPQFQGWRQQRLGPFADVDVVLFEAPPIAR